MNSANKELNWIELNLILADNETDSTEKLRRQHSRQECVVCWDNKRDVKFQPCGHVVCCVNCGINVAKCPYCREKIAGRMVTRVSNMPDDKWWTCQDHRVYITLNTPSLRISVTMEKNIVIAHQRNFYLGTKNWHKRLWNNTSSG